MTDSVATDLLRNRLTHYPERNPTHLITVTGPVTCIEYVRGALPLSGGLTGRTKIVIV